MAPMSRLFRKKRGKTERWKKQSNAVIAFIQSRLFRRSCRKARDPDAPAPGSTVVPVRSPQCLGFSAKSAEKPRDGKSKATPSLPLHTLGLSGALAGEPETLMRPHPVAPSYQCDGPKVSAFPQKTRKNREMEKAKQRRHCLYTISAFPASLPEKPRPSS